MVYLERRTAGAAVGFTLRDRVARPHRWGALDLVVRAGSPASLMPHHVAAYAESAAATVAVVATTALQELMGSRRSIGPPREAFDSTSGQNGRQPTSRMGCGSRTPMTLVPASDQHRTPRVVVRGDALITRSRKRARSAATPSARWPRSPRPGRPVRENILGTGAPSANRRPSTRRPAT